MRSFIAAFSAVLALAALGNAAPITLSCGTASASGTALPVVPAVLSGSAGQVAGINTSDLLSGVNASPASDVSGLTNTAASITSQVPSATSTVSSLLSQATSTVSSVTDGQLPAVSGVLSGAGGEVSGINVGGVLSGASGEVSGISPSGVLSGVNAQPSGVPSQLGVAAIFTNVQTQIESFVAELSFLTPSNCTMTQVTTIVSSIKAPIVAALPQLQALSGQPTNVTFGSIDGTSVLGVTQLAGIVTPVITLVLNAIGSVLPMINGQADILAVFTDLGNVCFSLLTVVISLVGGILTELAPALQPAAGVVSALGLTAIPGLSL